MGHKSKDSGAKIVHSIYNQLPAFTDIFDEETFYIFFSCLVCSAVVMVIILSRFVTIKAVD